MTFLRSVFAKSNVGEKQLVSETTKWSRFEKPDDSAITAFDMDAVRAIRENNVEKLRDLLREGRSFDACNQFGESLLHMACRRGTLEVVDFFVNEAKVKVDIRDDFGRTPIHDACWTTLPSVDVMSVLINALPSPSLLLAQDVRGHTPFHYAREDHWDKWIKFLRARESLIIQRISASAASNIHVVG